MKSICFLATLAVVASASQSSEKYRQLLTEESKFQDVKPLINQAAVTSNKVKPVSISFSFIAGSHSKLNFCLQ
jgi:hypothetical protein